MLIREQNGPTLIIRIFKREGNTFVTHLSVVQAFSILDYSPNTETENKKVDLFPFLALSTETQGPLVFGVHSRIASRSGVPFYNRQIGGKIEVNIYNFDVIKCRWTLLKTIHANVNGQIITCSAISDSTLLMFLSTGNDEKVYRLELVCINIIDMHTAPNSFLRAFMGYSSRRMDVPEELQRLKDFSLLNITNSCILLIGGKYGEINNVLNRVIWQGTLTDGNTKIIWKAINIGGSCIGFYPICFKLKDNVYITGDRKHCTSDTRNNSGDFITWHMPCPSCIAISNTVDRYNYKEKKMYLNAYSIPDVLPKSFLKIATDKNETFAVLVFKRGHLRRLSREEKMLIFTKKYGFVQVDDYKQSDEEQHLTLNKFFKCRALVCVDDLSNNYS